ncbi:MAG: MotA/TolQ/ExbB proton channel family protein [Alphaproteobacteria bacterium GM202ARS2]|nr:MotA/TolQ/ExbB proton channel family protein [Alphaproteobacteria bacterium GM202ARS2]
MIQLDSWLNGWEQGAVAVGVVFILMGVTLVGLSCLALWIILDKVFLLRRVERNCLEFEQAFWAHRVLNDFYEKVKPLDPHPMRELFMLGMEEYRLVVSAGMALPTGDSWHTYMSRLMHIELGRMAHTFDSRLNWLATLATTVPLLGVLAALWHTIQGLQDGMDVALALVMVRESLLFIFVALGVSVPSIVGYNLLAGRTNRLHERLSSFIEGLSSILARHLNEKGESRAR